MAVYEMSRRAVAEYLSDTKTEFVIGCVPSKEGNRLSKQGDTYPIRIVELTTTQNILPKVDCFLNTDGTTTVRVYLPKYDYFIKTKELHKAYSSRDSLSFGFHANPISFEYTLPEKEIKSYRDFKEAMEDLMQRISLVIKNAINMFQTEEQWTVVGIKLNVTFDIHSMSTK